MACWRLSGASECFCKKNASVAVPSWQREGVSWQGPVWCSSPEDAGCDGRPSCEGMGRKHGVGQTMLGYKIMKEKGK